MIGTKSVDNSHFLTLVFASLFLVSFGMISHNAFADTVSSTISLGNNFLIADGVNSNTNKIYVASPLVSFSSPSCYATSNKIFVINGATNNVIGNVTVGYGPVQVGVNPNTNKIYVANNADYTVSVIDGTTDSVMSTVSVASPLGVAVNPNTNKIYVSDNGHGKVDVIDGATNSVVNIIAVGSSYLSYPTAIAVNPNTNKIYVVISADNAVSVIDGTTGTVTNTISGFNTPEGIAVNSNTNKIYVSDAGNGTVSVIDGATNSVVNTISVRSSPHGVAVNPITNKIYVANYANDTISIIDGTTNSVGDTLASNSRPTNVAIDSSTNKVYVVNSGGQFCPPRTSSISVIQGSSSGMATLTAPQNLQATAGNSQVSLSWVAPSSNGGSPITNYKIYRGTSSGSETLLATTGNVISYTDNTVTNGQTYFYKVTAVNSAGESSQSNEASATPAAPATVSSAPTGLTATSVSSSQINLSWTAPANNGGSQVTGYMIQRSTDGGATWSTIVSNSGSTSTAYSDTGLAASKTYTYQVSAINSVGTSPPSNTASATTSGVTIASGIVLNNAQSTSGTVSSSNQMTLSGFNTGTGSNQLLLVGISANNNSPVYVTFNGMPLTQAVSSFFNNDAEFWYLKNPSGTGNIVVTMGGPTQAVVGAYSFSGVSQTLPIPTSVTGHNTTPNSPNISLTTKYPNDMVLDLPSIWGGVTLGSPTCTQQWDANVPNAITGASSSTTVQSPAAVSCKWTASSADFWDDVAVELKAN